jgi:transposase
VRDHANLQNTLVPFPDLFVLSFYSQTLVGKAMGLSTVKYWLKTWRTEGRRVAKSGYQKGHSHKITDTQVLQDIITKNPDKTLTEIGKMLPTPCAAETVRRGLKRLGFSYKKKSFIINNVIVHDAPLF